jgi:hypothetical protein
MLASSSQHRWRRRQAILRGCGVNAGAATLPAVYFRYGGASSRASRRASCRSARSVLKPPVVSSSASSRASARLSATVVRVRKARSSSSDRSRLALDRPNSAAAAARSSSASRSESVTSFPITSSFTNRGAGCLRGCADYERLMSAYALSSSATPSRVWRLCERSALSPGAANLKLVPSFRYPAAVSDGARRSSSICRSTLKPRISSKSGGHSRGRSTAKPAARASSRVTSRDSASTTAA